MLIILLSHIHKTLSRPVITARRAKRGITFIKREEYFYIQREQVSLQITTLNKIIHKRIIDFIKKLKIT